MPTTRAKARASESNDVIEAASPGSGSASHRVAKANASTSSSSPSPLATGRALILLQLLSRALTFILNQGLVRHAPPSVFGTAAIQFDLVAATILFLSREGVRNALLRSSSSPSSSSSSYLRLWPLRLGLVVTILTVLLYLSTAPTSTTSQPHFHVALALYVLGALLELSVEPLYVRATSSGNLRARVQAEGGQAGVRTALSFVLLAGLPYFGDTEGRGALLGLAIGYCAGSAWLAVRYIVEYGVAVVPSLLWTCKEGGQEDEETRTLAIANTRQSVVKHILSEADRIAVGYISPLGDQGGYAIAINYGSLVARIIFQPVEETLRLHWSRSLSSAATLPLLETALRASFHLVLLFPVFLPPLLPAVLPLLLPRKYAETTSAAATLQTYLTAYLPLLSLNGILESFHAASASPAQVAQQAWIMGASSATFVFVLAGLARRVSEGYTSYTREQALIYASCAAMAVRIAYAGVHAASFAKKQKTCLNVLPKPLVFTATAVAGATVWAAAASLGTSIDIKSILVLLGIGGVAGVSVLATIFMAERRDVRRLGSQLKGKTE